MPDRVTLGWRAGALQLASRYVIGGWVEDFTGSDTHPWVHINSLSGDADILVSADLSTGVEGRFGFQCHLRQGLKPGDRIYAHLVGSDGAKHGLIGSPRIVVGLESPLVLFSKEYDYLVYYSAKSACTWIRRLFSFLHSAEAKGPVDIHRMQRAFPVDLKSLPATSLGIIRDPVDRLISCFLDKVVSWFYEPAITRAEPLLLWRFGQDVSLYGRFSFLDFLDYLIENPYPSDLHFWPQPLYSDNVWVSRVESLENDIQDFYASERSELLPMVNEFIDQDVGRNASRNTGLKNRLYVPGAESLGIEVLSDMIVSGIGIRKESFLRDATYRRFADLVRFEACAYSYDHNCLD
ncbi:sulfotransferase family 2 domain-containing protein [Thiorhodococcus fuscus]|uniref:Sulfotransferase family 2 domain-containing protein n=1 Tax=Thiorhodococcus fuscus TaxID=527200 RepID=A0ABW4YEC9_9GAMM